MARPRIRFTREDYEQLPEDWRAELIEGDLVMIPAPDPSHQVIAQDLQLALVEHLGAAYRGRVLVSPTDVFIDDHNILQPDLLVLPEGTRPKPRPWKIPAPIWVAEVLSPGTAARDRGVKLRLYARHGVREAWVLDPDAISIEVHDLGQAGKPRVFGEGEAAESVTVPGLRVDVARVLVI